MAINNMKTLYNSLIPLLEKEIINGCANSFSYGEKYEVNIKEHIEVFMSYINRFNTKSNKDFLYVEDLGITNDFEDQISIHNHTQRNEIIEKTIEDSDNLFDYLQTNDLLDEQENITEMLVNYFQDEHEYSEMLFTDFIYPEYEFTNEAYLKKSLCDISFTDEGQINFDKSFFNAIFLLGIPAEKFINDYYDYLINNGLEIELEKEDVIDMLDTVEYHKENKNIVDYNNFFEKITNCSSDINIYAYFTINDDFMNDFITIYNSDFIQNKLNMNYNYKSNIYLEDSRYNYFEVKLLKPINIYLNGCEVINDDGIDNKLYLNDYHEFLIKYIKIIKNLDNKYISKDTTFKDINELFFNSKYEEILKNKHFIKNIEHYILNHYLYTTNIDFFEKIINDVIAHFKDNNLVLFNETLTDFLNPETNTLDIFFNHVDNKDFYMNYKNDFQLLLKKYDYHEMIIYLNQLKKHISLDEYTQFLKENTNGESNWLKVVNLFNNYWFSDLSIFKDCKDIFNLDFEELFNKKNHIITRVKVLNDTFIKALLSLNYIKNFDVEVLKETTLFQYLSSNRNFNTIFAAHEKNLLVNQIEENHKKNIKKL